MNDTFMKEKPILPLLTSMALPMVISMLVNSLYNIVDSFFVAFRSMSRQWLPCHWFSGTELCECDCHWIWRRNQRYDRIPSWSWQ